MTSILVFTAIILISVYTLAVNGHSDPGKMNRYDLIFAPIFWIALLGLAISWLYKAVMLISGVLS